MGGPKKKKLPYFLKIKEPGNIFIMPGNVREMSWNLFELSWYTPCSSKYVAFD